jgi:drug/metabolite transporter (DMT)-like permease
MKGKKEMSDERRGMIAATVSFSLFGFSFLFSKMALNLTEPAILLFARFFVTFAALNLMLVFRLGKLNLKGKNVLPALLLGIIQPVLYFVFENYGLKYTTASFTGMFSSSIPIFSAVLGALFLKERPSWRQWAFIAVSITGVLMISVGGSGGRNTLTGVVCLVLAYLMGAIYMLLSRRFSRTFTAFEMTYMMFLVGFVFFTGMALVQYRAAALPLVLSALGYRDFVAAALYLGLGSSVGAFLLANYALARLPVARATIFGNLSSMVSVLAGVVFLGEPFGPVQAVAFALILGGVWGVNRRGTR